MMNTTCGIETQNIKVPQYLKSYRLIAFDMDSTLIDMETIDEIAAAVGKKEEVAAITEAAMRGEISDYKESLRLRVALLKGISITTLEAIRDKRMRLNPGAEILVKTMQQNGLKVILVSGGFTMYTDALKERLGLDFARSNVLDTFDGQLTGYMVDQEWGDICDGDEKRRTLLEQCAYYSVDPKQSIAMGDGANDLPMMSVAGLAVAYHAKPIVRKKAHIAINEGGLERLLEVVLPQ